jgi:tRNA dimethylallyltransferase
LSPPETSQLPIVILCGPTASGKSSLACSLADSFDFEIVSADSRQVYRQMDIGTAKPTAEEQARAPHHLIDIIDPDEEFSVADYLDRAGKVIVEISERGKFPLLVGGTGLYVRALTEGLADMPSSDELLREKLYRLEREGGAGALYRRLQAVDPCQAEKIHPNNLVRVVRALEVYELTGVSMSQYQHQHQFGDAPYQVLKICLQWPREELYTRIETRVDQMIAEGLVGEVEELLASGYDSDLKSMKAIGYREIISYLSGETSLEEAVSQIKRETRRYAKRQETWFKKEKSIISVDSSSEIDRIQPLIECFLLQKGRGHGQNTI